MVALPGRMAARIFPGSGPGSWLARRRGGALPGTRAGGSAAQEVDARVEFADHLVHAPQAVAEHRLIRVGAEPLLVGRTVAQ